MRAPGHLIFAAGLLFLQPVATTAEELLFKDTGQYLGWQIPHNKFRACDKTILEIGTGRIKKTQDRCRTVPPPRLAFEWTGTLLAADRASGIIDIKEKNGTLLQLYLAPDNKGWKELMHVNHGDAVKATGPVPGRAEYIIKLF